MIRFVEFFLDSEMFQINVEKIKMYISYQTRFPQNCDFLGINEYNKYDRMRQVKEIIIYMYDVLIQLHSIRVDTSRPCAVSFLCDLLDANKGK
jgi:hypothetical protein